MPVAAGSVQVALKNDTRRVMALFCFAQVPLGLLDDDGHSKAIDQSALRCKIHTKCRVSLASFCRQLLTLLQPKMTVNATTRLPVTQNEHAQYINC